MKSVVLLFRKPVPHFFSIEKIFSAIADQLEKRVTVKKSILPYYTSSITNIFKNLLFTRRQKADVYHITGDIHYAVLALPKNRVLLTIHDCVFLHQYSGVKKWFFHHLFLKWPVRHCKLITTISEQSKKEIIQYSGCPPEKIQVINNPVSSTIHFREKEFNGEKPVLLFLGSTPNKNLPRVIEAIAGVSCILHVVGRIPKEQEEHLRLNQIEFIQSIGLSELELADAYSQADILMFPTLYEGFGLPILEAQKAGRVVLTSNLSPMKEVAGRGACLVDPNQIPSIKQGLLKIIEDTTYRNTLIQLGFENVLGYEADSIAEQYLRIYEQLATVAGRNEKVKK
jgi:glycosyltransferase involved in cell wall biosynthesis